MNWTLHGNRGNCGLEHVHHVYSKHCGTSWVSEIPSCPKHSENPGRTVLEASSSDVGGANPGASLHQRFLQSDSIPLYRPRFTRCLKCWDRMRKDLAKPKTTYCTATSATCSKLTCRVYCFFVPIPQTVNLFANVRTHFIQANPVEWCCRHAQVKWPKHAFADVCRKIYVHYIATHYSKRAWFKLAMLMQHLSSPWIPRGLAVLRSDLAVFGSDLTHLCPAQGGATFLCRSSRTAGRTKQIQVDTSSPWSTCIWGLPCRHGIASSQYVRVCHSVIGCLPFFPIMLTYCGVISDHKEITGHVWHQLYFVANNKPRTLILNLVCTYHILITVQDGTCVRSKHIKPYSCQATDAKVCRISVGS